MTLLFKIFELLDCRQSSNKHCKCINSFLVNSIFSITAGYMSLIIIGIIYYPSHTLYAIILHLCACVLVFTCYLLNRTGIESVNDILFYFIPYYKFYYYTNNKISVCLF